jgi:hypothetical protein
MNDKSFTVEEVREKAQGYSLRGDDRTAAMLDAYADMLERPADSGRVTKEMVEAACRRFYGERWLRMEKESPRTWMQVAISAALAAQGQGDRDAYEGARHDLLDWKHRALSAESILRSLGYRGIVPTEPPASPAGVPDGWVKFIRNCAANANNVWVTEQRIERARMLLAAAPSDGDGGAK